MRLLLVMAAALPAACSFSPADDAGRRFRCDVTAECPAGTTCLADGYCGESNDDPPDAGTAAACGTTDALRDDFESPAATAARWSCNDNVDIADGRMVVGAPAGTSVFGTCDALRWYLFADSGVSVRVSGPADDEYLEGILEVNLSDGTGYRAEAVNGILFFFRLDAEGSTELFRADYDPAEHAWWRLAERGGEVVFSTSSDGDTWEERAATRELPPPPVYARPSVQAWAGAERETEGAIVIDDVNQGATGSRCAIRSLVDGFDSSEIAHWWQPVGGATCSIAIDSGALALSSSVTYTDCGVESRLGYLLGEEGASIEVALPGDGAPSLNVELADPIGNAYRFHLHESRNIAVQIEAPGGDYDEVVDTFYDPARHRRWRFRQSDDMLYLETSGDEDTWIELHQLTPAGPLHDLVVRLFSYTEGADPDPSPVALDQLNE